MMGDTALTLGGVVDLVIAAARLVPDRNLSCRTLVLAAVGGLAVVNVTDGPDVDVTWSLELRLRHFCVAWTCWVLIKQC